MSYLQINDMKIAETQEIDLPGIIYFALFVLLSFVFSWAHNNIGRLVDRNRLKELSREWDWFAICWRSRLALPAYAMWIYYLRIGVFLGIAFVILVGGILHPYLRKF